MAAPHRGSRARCCPAPPPLPLPQIGFGGGDNPQGDLPRAAVASLLCPGLSYCRPFGASEERERESRTPQVVGNQRSRGTVTPKLNTIRAIQHIGTEATESRHIFIRS